MFDPQILYRAYRKLWLRGTPVAPQLLYRLNRFVTGCDLPPSVQLGVHVRFQHWGLGVVIADEVQVGDGVLFLPNARVLRSSPDRHSLIIIGDNAQLGSNSTILAARDLRVGRGAHLSAGTVYRQSVPERSSQIGEHARVLPRPLRTWPGVIINPATIQRLSRWFFIRRIPILPGLFYRLNCLLNHVIISADVELGRNVRLGRRAGLFTGTSVGDDVVIHQNAGAVRNVRRGRGCPGARVVIGSRVEIGADSVIVASDYIEIGNDVRIEDGTVITRSVPTGCTVAGVPARIVSKPADRRNPATDKP